MYTWCLRIFINLGLTYCLILVSVSYICDPYSFGYKQNKSDSYSVEKVYNASSRVKILQPNSLIYIYEKLSSN